LIRNVVINYNLGQPDMLTTYTYDPDTLITPERTIANRKSKAGVYTRSVISTTSALFVGYVGYLQ
jgi:hypothetical protein